MMEVVTGYKRSYRVVVRKMLNEAILSGYPRVYPTAIDLVNGYFVLGGAQIPIMTSSQLQNLSQSEYDARIALLKDYVIQQEGMNPFGSQFNENVVYDPTNCVPEIITTTTTEVTTTTTTTEEVTTTTTTESLSPPVIPGGTSWTSSGEVSDCDPVNFPYTTPVSVPSPQQVAFSSFIPPRDWTEIEYIEIMSVTHAPGLTVKYNGVIAAPGDILYPVNSSNWEHFLLLTRSEMLNDIVIEQWIIRIKLYGYPISNPVEYSIGFDTSGCIPPVTTTTTTV